MIIFHHITRSRDVIFEEGVTHFAKQLSSVIFPNNDDLFSYTPLHTETRSDEIVIPQKIPTPLHHEIAPRPLPITDLHKDKTTIDDKYRVEQERSGPELSGITPEWMGFDNKVGTTLASARVLCLDLVTNFIWSYLHQFFDDSHGLKTSLKPLKRPFDRYQSRLKAINNGRDIRQINW